MIDKPYQQISKIWSNFHVLIFTHFIFGIEKLTEKVNLVS